MKYFHSQSAINNHLFMTGSLHLFDSNGTATLNLTNFPEFGVEEPCIAVDEDNLIIYAIGGHNGTGEAVDFIQGYQFDDDTLTTGYIIEYLKNWRLDRPRYGSECFYLVQDTVEKLVVISGMPHKKYELTKRSKFYKDIVLFTIPPTNLDADIFGGILPSIPTLIQGERSVAKNIIDGKPLLYDDHILYVFGGKTHVESKTFVTRLDLNNIANSGGNQISSGMTLVNAKALPLVDQVQVNYADEGEDDDINDCYMIFAGQSYEDNKLVNDSTGIEIDNLQLFCNDAIAANINDETRRRRLNEDYYIPRFSSFDIELSQNILSDSGMIRNVTGYDTEQKSDVLIRKYEYGSDGVYYNLSVEIELCYENNWKLMQAEEYFLDIELSVDDEWMGYKREMDEDILNSSIKAYYGWNDGFGDVNVLNLQILNVSYNEEIFNETTFYSTIDDATKYSKKHKRKREEEHNNHLPTPCPTTKENKKNDYDNYV